MSVQSGFWVTRYFNLAKVEPMTLEIESKGLTRKLCRIYADSFSMIKRSYHACDMACFVMTRPNADLAPRKERKPTRHRYLTSDLAGCDRAGILNHFLYFALLAVTQLILTELGEFRSMRPCTGDQPVENSGGFLVQNGICQVRTYLPRPRPHQFTTNSLRRQASASCSVGTRI